MTPHSSIHAQIPWHRRLTARVLCCVTLLAGVSLLAVLTATSRAVERYALERSADDLLAARAAFNRLVESRARFAAAQTRLIAELPAFRAHISDARLRRDAATIGATADDYRRKLAADFVVVTDAAGHWIAQPGWSAETTGARPAALSGAIASARRGRPARQILTLDGALFSIVSEPAVFGREGLGTVTAGYRLDDAVAEELALVARCEVNLICGDRLCGSSLPLRERAELTSALANDRGRLGEIGAPPQLHSIGSARYVGGVYALLPPSSPEQLVLLQNWAPTQLALDRLRIWLVRIAAATFLVAVFGTLVFSRRITQPLGALAGVAKDIAAGNWSRRVPVAGPAEARVMAAAFNDMTLTLSHWHREARTRSLLLQAAIERLRSVTESASDALVSVDGGGRILFWNRRAESVFGYAEHEALGQSLAMLIPERYLRAHEDGIEQYLSRDDPKAKTIELHGLRRDGAEIPLELSLSSWRTGHDTCYTGVFRDITERKQAEEQGSARAHVRT